MSVIGIANKPAEIVICMKGVEFGLLYSISFRLQFLNLNSGSPRKKKLEANEEMHVCFI